MESLHGVNAFILFSPLLFFVVHYFHGHVSIINGLRQRAALVVGLGAGGRIAERDDAYERMFSERGRV